MKKITNKITGLMIVAFMALGVGVLALPVSSVNALGIQGGANSAQGNGQSGCLVATDKGGKDCSGSSETPIFQTITNVLLFIIGGVSVIMLIIGGIRYTISGGDSSAVTSAKNTILYAIVGIVVALLAYAIVNFVLGSFAA